MYKLAIIIVLSIQIGYFLFGNDSIRISEGMNAEESVTSDEAIQNIASLYNKDQMTVTNLDVTSSITSPTIETINTRLEQLNNRITSEVGRLDGGINGNANNLKTEITNLSNSAVKLSQPVYRYV